MVLAAYAVDESCIASTEVNTTLPEGEGSARPFVDLCQRVDVSICAVLPLNASTTKIVFPLNASTTKTCILPLGAWCPEASGS
jgi:hypothetical protein